jgi:hypothetical protein
MYAGSAKSCSANQAAAAAMQRLHLLGWISGQLSPQVVGQNWVAAEPAPLVVQCLHKQVLTLEVFEYGLPRWSP